MCLPVGGLPDLECLSVDNTSFGVQMLDSRCPSKCTLVVFPLCPLSAVWRFKFLTAQAGTDSSSNATLAARKLSK